MSNTIAFRRVPRTRERSLIHQPQRATEAGAGGQVSRAASVVRAQSAIFDFTVGRWIAHSYTDVERGTDVERQALADALVQFRQRIDLAVTRLASDGLA